MYIPRWATKLLVYALHIHLLKRVQDSKGNRKSLYFIRQKKKKQATYFEKELKMFATGALVNIHNSLLCRSLSPTAGK